MASELSNPIAQTNIQASLENPASNHSGILNSALANSPLSNPSKPDKQGLYNPSNEHDACGVGFVAHIKGKKSHDIVQKGLQLLTNLTHRGATGYDPKLGDGAGLLMQMPDAFMRKEASKLDVQLPAAGEYAVGNVFLPQVDKNREQVEA
ncbi:MAG: hypothetical protein RL063_367, partial [Pseudomonadota bacterium]